MIVHKYGKRSSIKNVTLGGELRNFDNMWFPISLLTLLLRNRFDLQRKLLWLFLNICGLSNAQEKFQISQLVFAIWRPEDGNKTGKNMKNPMLRVSWFLKHTYTTISLIPPWFLTLSVFRQPFRRIPCKYRVQCPSLFWGNLPQSAHIAHVAFPTLPTTQENFMTPISASCVSVRPLRRAPVL